MLTERQLRHTRNGATALNAAARLLDEAVEELAASAVISAHDWCVLDRCAKQLSKKADVISARAVRKKAFTASPNRKTPTEDAQ